MNSFSNKIIFVLAGFVFGIFYLKRYFSNQDHTILFIEPKPTTITVESSRSFECFDKLNVYQKLQKGQFWVLQNYIRANRWFACDESITLTTIGDPKFLENLKTLVEHWNGPVSVALYTPGNDLDVALLFIKYLRMCYPSLITKFVSFHLFFEIEHLPRYIPSEESARSIDLNPDNCTMPPPWQMMKNKGLYREEMGLKFPINVGRNIARDGATTHFLLASDIEMFPSRNVIPNFLNMIRQNLHNLQATKLSVFVLPPFEVVKNAFVPSDKTNLLAMLANGTAIQFHRFICPYCHVVPGYKVWLNTNQTEGLHVIHTSKGKPYWEPFYISTNQVPYFDERMDWEGRCNKMVQAYSMCVLGYDYHILDNAFLVHKPGIRVNQKSDIARDKFAATSVQVIHREIEPNIRILYGVNKNCTRITKC